MSSDAVLVVALVAGLAALVLAVYYARVVLAADPGNDRMRELSAAIREGADAFMRREYTWVAVFVVVLAVLISVVLPWGRHGDPSPTYSERCSQPEPGS